MVERLRGFGVRRPREPVLVTRKFDISAFITYPKFILVDIRLVESLDDYGSWMYTVTRSRSPDRFGMPILHISLRDTDNEIGGTLYDGLRTAILTGKRFINVRLWKRVGDGVFTQEERDRGYSENYPIIGLFTWSKIQAVDMPDWDSRAEESDTSLEEAINFYRRRLIY